MKGQEPRGWWGPRLRRLLDEKGVSDVECAAAVGLKTAVTVINWCRWPEDPSASEPRATQVGKLADLLDVSTDYLVGISEQVA